MIIKIKTSFIENNKRIIIRLTSDCNSYVIIENNCIEDKYDEQRD